MPTLTAPAIPPAEALFRASLDDVHARTDRLFAVLMAVQFAGGVVLAAAVSPATWRGATATVHPHLVAAVVVGGAIAALPIWLAVTRPGRGATRAVVAVAQMLFSMLLIHLTGGRIETHFHVFGSIAFLALYRDWRVLAVATAVTAVDHLVRGAVVPTSVYGTLAASPWRTVEHAAWVVFEDVILVIGCVRSVGEMRRVADRTAALAESEARTRAIVTTALDAIVTFDAAGRVVGWNPQAERTFGWAEGDVLGRPLTETVVPHDRRAGHDRGRAAFLAGGAWPLLNRRVETTALHRDGHLIPVEATISPQAAGASWVFTIFTRDVSDRRRHEAELRAARDAAQAATAAAQAATAAAEAASRSKSAFLANMSHEIRTPMTAIVGHADLLVDPSRTRSDGVDSAQVIHRNAHHLLGLISDVLDVSKIEAGRMTVERSPVDLPALVGEVAELARPRAVERGLDLRVVLDGPVPRTVSTDALRVKQVLTNLLGNATKFTATGSVTLTVGCDGRALRFDVADTGIGLTPAQAGRLFQPFAQADESTTRKFGGTGLGLAISRRLAELLGGTVTVRSEAGVGSTFTATVDAGDVAGVERVTTLDAAPPPTTTAAAAVPRLDGVRVLLAEDGFDNQMLIGLYLRSAGAELTVADNGRLGLDAARAARAAGRAFDLILTDMQMPELDGYGLAAALRADAFATPVVALTAHAMADDRAKCVAAGCDDYLSKPVDRAALVRLAGRLTAGTAGTAGTADKAIPHPPAVAA